MAIERPESLVSRFDEVSRRAVAAGADAILAGCGYYGPVFAAAGYTHVSDHPDVPVYDCGRMGYELARTLYRLHTAGVDPSSKAFPKLPEPNASAARNLMARMLTGRP